ncbi:MAG: response regulator transcription factor [Pyrinomonadaceae bacterium]|nr:response regulator transcription factor [Pyrinomonadaceae bacterium]
MTRVAVVAASEVVRAGLEAVVSARDSFETVGSFADFAELEQGIEDAQPDVVLLDIDEKPEDRLDALYSLARAFASAHFVLLTSRSQGAWTIDALRSGVRAILERDAMASEIVAAIEAVSNNLVVVQVETMNALLPIASRNEREIDELPVERLSNREIEVLGMLAEGLGNKMIAYRLGISEHTVKFHVGSIFGKLGVSSRTEAVTLGIRQGMIML